MQNELYFITLHVNSYKDLYEFWRETDRHERIEKMLRVNRGKRNHIHFQYFAK